MRFDENDSPQNIFNSNGSGTYSSGTGTPTTCYGFATAASTPVCSFEWFINSDYLDTAGTVLSDLSYTLSIDFGPSAAMDSLNFDPINDVGFADQGIGTNATGNGGSTAATTTVDYQNLINSNNLAQN